MYPGPSRVSPFAKLIKQIKTAAINIPGLKDQKGVYMVKAQDADEESLQSVRDYLNETIARHGIEPENIVDHRLADISGQLFGTELELDPTNMKVNSPSLYENVRWLSFVPLSDYNQMTGRSCTLAADEILIYPHKSEYKGA